MNAKYVKGLLLFLVLIVVLGFLTHEKQTNYHFKPAVSNEHSIDIGTIDLAETAFIRKTLSLRNFAKDSLRIYEVIDGCDCTQSSIINTSLGPDDSIKIIFNYFPSKYNDSGLIHKTLFLRTNFMNSDKDSIQTINILGEVKA